MVYGKSLWLAKGTDLQPKPQFSLPYREPILDSMRQLSKQTLGSLQAFFEDLPYNVKLHLELATLLGNVSLGLEVTALQHQQDYLENLISIRIATPEIANLALGMGNKLSFGMYD